MTLELILMAALGVIVTALGAWFGGRRSGARDTADKEKAKDNERIIDNMVKRVDAERDAGGGDAAKRLRDEWSRPD